MKKICFILLFASFFSCKNEDSSSTGKSLTPAEFSDELKSDGKIILLDVRSPEEVAAGFIEGAENLNFNDEGFSSSVDSLDHSKKYFIYCASGKRSGKAAELMKEKGFQNVTTLEGGFNAWKEMELPVKTN